MKASRESKKRTLLSLTIHKKLPRDEFMAASVGDTKWLHYSLRDGHDPNMFDKDGLAPIHLAALHGKLECMKLLIENYNVDVNLESDTGHLPHLLVINMKNKKVALPCLKYLVSKGADVNSANYDGETAVHKAAAEGMEDCLKFLLAKGADADQKDVRDKTAHDLAKIWCKRKCARIVQKRVWNHDKEFFEQERMKMIRLRQEFQDLQHEALHQLMNEHDFFGNVSFNNWMDDKGFKGDNKQLKFYPNKKQVDGLMDGMISRLFANGTLKDIARRLEKLLHAYVRAAEMKALSGEKLTGMSIVVPKSKFSKAVKYELDLYGRSKDFPTSDSLVRKNRLRRSTEVNVNAKELGYQNIGKKQFFESQERSLKPGHRNRSKMQFFESDDELLGDDDDSPKHFKPTGIYSVLPGDEDGYVRRFQGYYKTNDPWNFSTNMGTYPVTDITHPTSVSIGTKPDFDRDNIQAPGLANITFKIIKKSDKIILKLSSRGRVETIQVPITVIDPDYIEAAIDSLPFGKKGKYNIPFRFHCIHLFDIQKKRPAKVYPLSEIVNHLKMVLEGYLFGCHILYDDQPNAIDMNDFS